MHWEMGAGAWFGMGPKLASAALAVSCSSMPPLCSVSSLTLLDSEGNVRSTELQYTRGLLCKVSLSNKTDFYLLVYHRAWLVW